MIQVKIFDFEHEQDLENAINKFLQSENKKILSINYRTSHFYDGKHQIYSFSALVSYEMTSLV